MPYSGLKYNKLSLEIEQKILSDRENGVQNPYRCADSAVLRRNENADRASIWRPAFVRDIEKIIHLPYYNRYADKTQVFRFIITTILHAARCMCSLFRALRAI